MQLSCLGNRQRFLRPAMGITNANRSNRCDFGALSLCARHCSNLPLKLCSAKGLNLEKSHSRLKTSISLENFNLNLQNYPQKLGPWSVARLKISISLEIFNPGGSSSIFSIFGTLGSTGFLMMGKTRNT